MPEPPSYQAGFARACRHLYGSYGRTFGQRLLALGLLQPPARALDLGCGSGELLGLLSERGFEVTGVDREADMLELARAAVPQAALVQADLAELDLAELPGPYDLITSTSHSMNHLADPEALQRCLEAVARLAAPGAHLVVDFATRRGLERWNAVTVEEEAEHLLVRRGFYDEGTRVGYTRLSGFFLEGGHWERFAAVLRFYAFPLAEIVDLVEKTGWTNPIFCSRTDLAAPLQNPESRRDVVLRARRSKEAVGIARTGPPGSSCRAEE